MHYKCFLVYSYVVSYIFIRFRKNISLSVPSEMFLIRDCTLFIVWQLASPFSIISSSYYKQMKKWNFQ